MQNGNENAGAAAATAAQLSQTASETTGALSHSLNMAAIEIIQLAPRVIAALILVGVGLLLAKLAARAVTAICEKSGLQRAAARSGLTDAMRQIGLRGAVPQIIGTIVFWLLLGAVLMVSFDILNLPAVTSAVERVVAFIPRLLVAALVVVVGMLLTTLLRNVIATSAERLGVENAGQLAAACYFLMAFMTCIAALEQMQIEFRLLSEAVLIAFGAVALAFGLSIGLGGREVMSGILAGYYVRQRWQAGDPVQVAGLAGSVREVGPVTTIVETEQDGLLRRHTIPNVRMLNEAVR